jgi:hypothetical protein
MTRFTIIDMHFGVAITELNGDSVKQVMQLALEQGIVSPRPGSERDYLVVPHDEVAQVRVRRSDHIGDKGVVTNWNVREVEATLA